MKPLVYILVVVGIVAAILLIRVVLRTKGLEPHRLYATRDQIPSIVSKLQQTGSNGSFVVFMFSIPNSRDETLPNLQYSIENGRIGFDWVLIAPQNIKDEAPVSAFIESLGYAVSKHRMNDVSYLRVEGDGIEDIGPKILRDFYHLPAEAELELIVEGFGH